MVPRAHATYDGSASRKFVLKQGESYEKQYSHVYHKRLTKLKPILKMPNSASGRAMAAAARDGFALCEKIVELRPQQKACVIGTVFKQMALRPSPLKRLAAAADPAASSAVGGAGALAQYLSDDDELVLEDASGRVTVTGSVARELRDRIVTGVVMMVCGVLDDEGTLVAVKICPAGLAPQTPRLPLGASAQDAPLVLVVSGLGFGAGDEGAGSMPDGAGVGNALHMLLDYVGGHVGGAAEQKRAARIARVIIAGDSVARDVAEASMGSKSANHYTATGTLTAKQQLQLTEPMAKLDRLLAELAATVPVDLMPGATDPANIMMPQQPLHRCLLPRASALPGFRAVTNPYAATIGGVDFLGHSGQPLHDLGRFSSAALEEALQWRHIAPTAPNSLPCYPFSSHDPFVLDASPCVRRCAPARTRAPLLAAPLSAGRGSQAAVLQRCFPAHSPVPSPPLLPPPSGTSSSRGTARNLNRARLRASTVSTASARTESPCASSKCRASATPPARCSLICTRSKRRPFRSERCYDGAR